MPGLASQFTASPTKRSALAAKRSALALALALPAAAWMVLAGAASPASACSTSAGSHCYAEEQNANTNANHGIFGDVDAHCLYQPNNGNFATQEMWDSTSNGAYWEEIGLYSGAGSNINYGNKNWFWADSRPGGGYHEHDQSATASVDTEYAAEIQFVSSNTWDLWGDANFVQIGTSTSQSATLNTGIAGSEYTSGSGSGIRDIGNIYNLERESTGNSWAYWGSNAFNADNGPGFYIHSSYSSSASHLSWSGPC